MIQQKILKDLFEKSIQFNNHSVGISEYSISKQKIKDFLQVESKRWLGKKTERMKARLLGRYNDRKLNSFDINDKIVENEIQTMPCCPVGQSTENKAICLNSNETSSEKEIIKPKNKKHTLICNNQINQINNSNLMNKKVYAICLNNSQIFNLFQETFLFKDPTNFNEITLSKAVNDYYQSISRSNQNRLYSPDEKKFYVRKGICIQLKKVIKKIVRIKFI